MFKKKNNLICTLMIIFALAGGISTIALDYHFSSDNSTLQTLSPANDQDYNDPFKNDDTDIEPAVVNYQNNKYQISTLAAGGIVIYASIASLAIVYLISKQTVFINRDKKWLYGLSSSLLTVVISFAIIHAVNNLDNNTSASSSMPNNNQQNNSEII